MDPELEEKHKLRVDEELRGRNEESRWEIEPVSQLEQSCDDGDTFLRLLLTVDLGRLVGGRPW